MPHPRALHTMQKYDLVALAGAININLEHTEIVIVLSICQSFFFWITFSAYISFLFRIFLFSIQAFLIKEILVKFIEISSVHTYIYIYIYESIHGSGRCIAVTVTVVQSITDKMLRTMRTPWGRKSLHRLRNLHNLCGSALLRPVKRLTRLYSADCSTLTLENVS